MTCISDHYDHDLSAADRARLGTPTGPDMDLPVGDGGFYREYTNGRIYQRPAADDCFAVYGDIFTYWFNELGATGGRLGYPISDEHDSPHARGRVSDFEHGQIYWAPGSGAYLAYGDGDPSTAPPQAFGQWHVRYTSGVVGVHAALLHTNSVLFFSYLVPPDPRAPPQPQRNGSAAVLDLETGGIFLPTVFDETGAPTTLENVFCSGEAFLDDGRLVVAGGDREGDERVTGRASPVNTVYVVDPDPDVGAVWRLVGHMQLPRWYPTAVTLPTGDVGVAGGSLAEDFGHVPNTTFDVCSRTATTHVDPPSPLVTHLDYSYPFVFVVPVGAPSGTMMVHHGHTTSFFEPTTLRPTVESITSAAFRTYGVQAPCVLLPLRPENDYAPSVMMFGGGIQGSLARRNALTSCERLDFFAPTLRWRLTRDMPVPRVMGDAVLLPDGTIFVCNGSETGTADNAPTPCLSSYIYDPDADTWSPMANATVPRLYHSTALLLPDARVLTAGSDSAWNLEPLDRSEVRVEIFSPPYLFGGDRPALTDAPLHVDYGAVFHVQSPDAMDVDSLVLVKCGVTTHSFNMGQRWVGLVLLGATVDGTITTRAPPTSVVAPPGWYMLFLLRMGVPSVARFIRLGGPATVDTAPPRQPPQPGSNVPSFLWRQVYRPPPAAYWVPGPDPGPVERAVRRLTREVADLRARLDALEKKPSGKK